MSDIVLGKKQNGNSPDRDAVHVAVKLAVAGCTLNPRDGVTIKNGVAVDSRTDPIGIVDPFLNEYVYKGEMFYIFLFPNTVTGMRHHWQHPFFDGKEAPEDGVEEARKWIEAFCFEWNFNYEELIHAATSNEKYRYVVANGIDLHSKDELGEDYNTFWEMLSVLTGRKFNNDHKNGLHWSCSC